MTETKKTGEREPIVLKDREAADAIHDMRAVYRAAIQLPLAYILDGYPDLMVNSDFQRFGKFAVKYMDARILWQENMLLLDQIGFIARPIFRCGLADYSIAAKAAMLGVALQDYLEEMEYDILVGPLYRLVGKWDYDHASKLWPAWLDGPL